MVWAYEAAEVHVSRAVQAVHHSFYDSYFVLGKPPSSLNIVTGVRSPAQARVVKGLVSLTMYFMCKDVMCKEA